MMHNLSVNLKFEWEKCRNNDSLKECHSSVWQDTKTICLIAQWLFLILKHYM